MKPARRRTETAGKPLVRPAPRWFFACCLLPVVCGLLPIASAQNLFPSGGNKKNNIPTSPQPLGPVSGTRDSAARRGPARTLPGPRPDTVQLPYNLVWGDSAARLASLFAGVGAKITNKKNDGPKEIWTVDGLIAPNLQSSLFTFQSGQLLAVEFDYSQPNWTTDQYNDQMGQFRRLLESKCASPGELVSRGPAEPPAPDATVKETLTGYQWKHGDTIVQLFYFSAEDSEKNQNFRSISVHYHYTDPYAAPEPPPDTATASPSPGSGDAAPAVGAASTPDAAATSSPDPAHPAPGVTVTPPRGGNKKGGLKPTPGTPENDPLPEH